MPADKERQALETLIYPSRRRHFALSFDPFPKPHWRDTSKHLFPFPAPALFIKRSFPRRSLGGVLDAERPVMAYMTFVLLFHESSYEDASYYHVQSRVPRLKRSFVPEFWVYPSIMAHLLLSCLPLMIQGINRSFLYASR
jgi:hypothetical protein